MTLFSIIAGLFLFGSPSAAMSPPEKAVVDRGLDALYALDHATAEREFRKALEAEPESPVFSLGLAASAWWRMENSFALPGSPEERAFVAALEAAIGKAKKARDREGTAESYLYLGAGYGLRGRWRAANKHWLGAYLDGRRAYRNARKAVKLDPRLYDAYLGLGAFDYYVATLSRFVRALSFASGGDRQEGLRELRLAAEQGEFSGVAAKLLLVGIHWTFEKDPRAAWKLLEEVHERYPRSPMVLAMRLLGLFHLRDAQRLKKEARAYLEKAEKGEDFFSPIDRSVGRCFLGLGEQLAGDYPRALEEYAAALEAVPPGHKWRSVIRLFMGEALDLLGRREEAVASYRAALKEPPLWGVPRYAKRLLKHPFKAGDEPLPSRNTELP